MPVDSGARSILLLVIDNFLRTVGMVFVRMTFEECVRASFADRALVAEFDRLKRTNLSLRGTGLDLRIDFASGRFEGEVKEFVEFVKECVWDRVKGTQ